MVDDDAASAFPGAVIKALCVITLALGITFLLGP